MLQTVFTYTSCISTCACVSTWKKSIFLMHTQSQTHRKCRWQAVKPLVADITWVQWEESICHDQSEERVEFVIGALIWTGLLVHSAVGKADKVLACVCECVSVQVCGTLCSYQTSLPFSWSRTDPLDKLTKWQRIPPSTHPPRHTYTHMHIFPTLHASTPSFTPSLLSWSNAQHIMEQRQVWFSSFALIAPLQFV